MKPNIYIDGKEGTTGLQIYERLGGRDDIELLLIDEDKRKDIEERRKFLNAADIAFLCLPDAAAREAVSLIENDTTRVIDASTAHLSLIHICLLHGTAGAPVGELGVRQVNAVIVQTGVQLDSIKQCLGQRLLVLKLGRTVAANINVRQLALLACKVHRCV